MLSISVHALFHLQFLEKENSRLVSDMENLLEELNCQKQQINSMKNENLKLESDLKNNKVHGQNDFSFKKCFTNNEHLILISTNFELSQASG